MQRNSCWKTQLHWSPVIVTATNKLFNKGGQWMWGAASQLHGLSRAGVPLQQLGWGGARDWTSLSFTDYAKAFACVDHNRPTDRVFPFFHGMGCNSVYLLPPHHLSCLLSSLSGKSQSSHLQFSELERGDFGGRPALLKSFHR